MNRSLLTDLRREIRRSLARYCSILLMIALGCMFLVGLRSAAPDMRLTADEFFDEHRFYDLQLLSTLGLTQEDVEAVRALDGVADCRGGWAADGILGLGDDEKVVKLLSLDGEMNCPVLVEGRLPEAPCECAVDERMLLALDLAVGDPVTLQAAEADTLAETEYTVTALVQSPLYLSIYRGNSSLGDGSVAGFVLLPEAAFAAPCYSTAYLTLEGASALDAYSTDYESLTAARTGPVEDLLRSRARDRWDGLRAEKRAELDQARAALDAEWADTEARFDESRFMLSVVGDELGLRDLDAAWETALQAHAEAEAELAAGEEALDALAEPEVWVLDRNSNYGFVSYSQNAERMSRLAKLFPVIFYLVAALVCLTTMTRMVEEERIQIGTVKAMGYGTWAIAGKFLIYGISAAVFGGLLGAAVGTVVIPWIIFSSYAIMYIPPKLHIRLYWELCLTAGGAGVLCTVAATLGAVFSTARQSAAALMRPKAPKAGKRILLERVTPLWRRLRFSVKVSARNLFRYKKRMTMTVIGVAGCTGMLIAGLGLHSSIFDILDVQFYDLYRYDIQLNVDPEDPEVLDAVSDLLQGDPAVESWAGLNTRSVQFSANGHTVDGYLSVTADPEALEAQIVFRDLDTKARMHIPADGAVIDRKLAELLEVEAGDELSLDIGRPIRLRVSRIREHYVYHFATVTADCYAALTGEDCRDNELLISVRADAKAAVPELCTRLMATKGVRSASNIDAMATDFRETMEVVDSAVMIIIVSAAALAFVVLYNLTNINVTERIRELATLKVLGFTNAEVGMYIYRENFVLTLLGIALGQLFGKYLCTFLVRTIEMDIVMFGRDARLQNYLLSIGLTLGFALLVNFFMYFRIKRIDMVQSLKSVEE